MKEVTKDYKILKLQSDANSKNLYDEKVDAVQVFNYSGKPIYVTNKDVDLMAQVVYAESCSEPYEGKVAVASVILNRLQNPKFPKSVNEVVTQRYAFSCVRDGKISVTPTKDCYTAVFDALEGKDPTSKATYFYNPKISTSTWMNNIAKYNVKNIGHHVFFIAN
ncbi:cell wall hydrolase [Clostridium hydrogenum]|uniref:cell wall hydrolase n=1 Tax=Clostridium hydrogenum TaxID=2855764 RepID=UPI0038B34B76